MVVQFRGEVGGLVADVADRILNFFILMTFRAHFKDVVHLVVQSSLLDTLDTLFLLKRKTRFWGKQI